MAYNIQIHHGFGSINKALLSELVQSGFGRHLSTEYLQVAKPSYIILAASNQSYLGAAVIEEFIPKLLFQDSGKFDSIDYLDKFVVRKELHGNGVGKELWQMIDDYSPHLFFRVKADNQKAVNFYLSKKCDVYSAEGKWNVFGKNIPAEHKAACINYALQKPETLVSTQIC